MVQLPFFASTQPVSPVGWQDGERVTREDFLRDVADLGNRLPVSRHVLNDCADRYSFLVGFAAAMTRGQVSLLPGNRVPRVLEQLRRAYPDLYCLADRPIDCGDIPLVVYRGERPGSYGGTPLAELAFPADQDAVVAFTSGSTGAPRPHRKHWGQFVREAQVAHQSLALPADTRGGIVCTVAPQHMYGFIASVMLAIQGGHALHAGQPLYPEDIRNALSGCPEPRILVTTPLQLRACVLDGVSLPQLGLILSSAAPLDRDIAAQAEKRFGVRVMEFYGSTETGAMAARRPVETETWTTFEGVEVGQEEGCLRVSAPQLRETVRLNDRVEVLDAHRFVLHGRDTDMVKIGGKRASLAALNSELLAIPGVADGVFFDPGDGGESRLAAFVVAPGRAREELLGELRRRIDPVFLPRPLRLVERLPRNNAGKLPRADLLRLLEETVAPGVTDKPTTERG